MKNRENRPKKILSFGGGLQTTALTVLAAEGKLEIDEVVFADTGAEKPETYWYMENYIKPIFNELQVPFVTVKTHLGDLYEHCWKIRDVPSVRQRWCTDKFKIRPIKKLTGPEVIRYVGFSLDEAYRAKRAEKYKNEQYPLLERQITAQDCHHLILSYGLPVPLKSSCYFCPFQHPVEWNWLKNNHLELFQKALALEANYHQKKPGMRDYYGLLRGTPLWKMKDGLQPEMFADIGNSCWSGHCGH